MILINFAIKNPFSTAWNILHSRNGSLTENKSWELNFYRTSWIISVSFDFTMRQSHAGLNIDFGLFGYMLEFSICDNRHWDPKTNSWII